jgi:hypothetical protein
MDKYFIDKAGKAEERIQGEKGKKDVHFPLCLAVKYMNNVPMDCPDFLLNATKGRLFIPTDTPFPEGSKLMLHFYIPPKTKLLGEFKGKVEEDGRVNGVRGNFIKISDFLHIKMSRLEAYLEEKQHLIDEKV